MLSTPCQQTKTPQLADHVLQFLFHGVTRFRMPFACFPTNQANSANLYMNVWDCVDALQDWEFKIVYIILDDSSNNRSFLQMHFDGNPVHAKLKNPNRANSSQEVIFLPDLSHVTKKIRNSIFNNGEGEKNILDGWWRMAVQSNGPNEKLHLNGARTESSIQWLHIPN